MAARPSSLPHPLAHLPPDTLVGAQQQAFTQLMADIEHQRRLLAEWQDALAGVRQRYARDVAPLRRTHHAALTALAQYLDTRQDDAALSRAERRSLSAAIARLCAEHQNDAVLHELHTRHCGETASQAPPSSSADTPADDDWQAQQEHAARQRAAQRQAHHGARLAAARAARQQAAPATQSLRAVYRKLASSLHPDRAPDPAERARKTALMQRVNQAYAAGELLELLQLQLEIEQIDAAHLTQLDATRRAHYTQILAGQLHTLRQQVRAAEQEARQTFGVAPQASCKPARLAALLRASLQGLQQHTAWLQQQLRQLRADPGLLADWLRALQRAQHD